MLRVLLDTNVLWPSLQRDFFLELAAGGLFHPVWSEPILAEVAECEVRKRVRCGAEPEIAEIAARRLVDMMSVAFDGSCVTGWEGLIGTYGLPDSDDEHVLAAAVAGGADAIVTVNDKDFPRGLVPHSIEVTPPERFALDAVSVDPAAAWSAINRIATRYKHPKATVDEVLTTLELRYKMAAAVAPLRSTRRD